MAKKVAPKPADKPPLKPRSRAERTFWLFLAIVVGLSILMLCMALLAGALSHSINN